MERTPEIIQNEINALYAEIEEIKKQSDRFLEIWDAHKGEK